MISSPSGIFLAIVLLLSASAADARAEEAKKQWTNKAEVSVVNTNGNTRTTNMSAKNTFRYNWEKVDLELIGSALQAKDGDEITAEQYSAAEKVDWKFSEFNYLFEKFNWEKNSFAGINNRYDASAGYGRVLFKFPQDKLVAELGGGHVWEDRTNRTRNNFASGRAYSKYIHQFTEKSEFSQDVEYLHNFEDKDGYRVNTETALTGSVTTHLQLKASFMWKKVNQPPPGFGKHDTTTSMALVVNF